MKSGMEAWKNCVQIFPVGKEEKVLEKLAPSLDSHVFTIGLVNNWVHIREVYKLPNGGDVVNELVGEWPCRRDTTREVKGLWERRSNLRGKNLANRTEIG